MERSRKYRPLFFDSFKNIFFGYTLFSCVFIISLALIHYYSIQLPHRNTVKSNEVLNIEMGKTAINNVLEKTINDLRFLSKRSQVLWKKSVDETDFETQLTDELFLFFQEKAVYDQIRFINLSGMERIRINYQNGRPSNTPEDQLQNKLNRYYFNETIALDAGNIYVSPLDLNIEHGQIEQPQKPMLRVGTPIINAYGHKLGILVINYPGSRLLSLFHQATSKIADHVMLINKSGYWLSNPQRENEWGFMFDKGPSFANSFPQIWKTVKDKKSGQLETKDDELFSFTTVFPVPVDVYSPQIRDANYFWKIISVLHKPSLLVPIEGFLKRYLLYYSIGLVLLLLLSAAISRHLIHKNQTTICRNINRQISTSLKRINQPAVYLDSTGAVIYCNTALCKIIGVEEDDLVGKNWINTVIEESHISSEQARFREITENPEASYQHDNRIVDSNGNLRRMSWCISLFFNSKGKISELVYFGQDLTESKETEVQLLHLSQAVEQSPSTVMIVDEKGMIEYVNPKFTQLTQYKLEEVRGKSPGILKSGKTSKKDYMQLWDTVKSGKVWRGTFCNKKKNGELYWETATISAIRTATGDISHYLAVKEDITERVRLEERFRLFVEAAPNGIVIVDHDGEIIHVNTETENIFGYPRNELLGNSVEILIPDRFRNNHRQQRLGFLQINKSRKMGEQSKLLGKHKDGTEIPLEIGLSPVKTEEGEFVLASITDITERYRLKNDLEIRNREITKSQALATVGRMANMVAHDLRNPLSSIKMALQIFTKNPRKNWGMDEQELNKIALDQVKYMEGIMTDLLTYSRPVMLNPEWISIDKLLESTILLAQKQIDDYQVKVETWFQSGLPTLHGDAYKLKQVFLNLITNAVQATENNGGRKPKISITTQLELGVDHPIIRVIIADNGSGFDVTLKEKYFEPFYTTKSKGTGLGLAIVKQILDQHSGQIELNRTEKYGTNVVVILPTHAIKEKPQSETDKISQSSLPSTREHTFQSINVKG